MLSITREKKEVIQTVNTVLATKFTGIESDKDQLEKIYESLDCAKQVLGHLDPNFIQMIQLAKSKYPQLLDQLTALSLNKNSNCLTM